MDDAERERRNEANRKYRARHREAIAAREREKRLARGDELRAKEAAYRETHREEIRDRYADWSARTYEGRRDALNAYQRERAKADPQRRLEYQRTFWAKQPPARHFARRADRMAKKYGSPERLDWTNLPMGPCIYCGTDADVTWDHVEPLSRGGRNHSSNLVRCCLPCNRSKNAMTPEEWQDPERRARVIARRAESSRRLLAERRELYNARRRERRRLQRARELGLD